MMKRVLYPTIVDKPRLNVVCLGWTGSGKTTLLQRLSGNEDFKAAINTGDDDSYSADESLQPGERNWQQRHIVTPTVGFLIRAMQFRSCYLTVKEIGGL